MTMKVTMTKPSRARIARLYREGATLRDLQEQYGHSLTTLLRILRSRRVKIRPRGRVPA
jgi:uncharacterized protein YerC